jgi:lipoate---protein ligase
VTWSVERSTGRAAAFHARELDSASGRSVWVFDVDHAAIVLGSAQPIEHVDLDACRTHDVEVVRRRSGGGAVLVRPGSCTWVDVVVPRADPLWDDDVGRASHWLGDAWSRALVSVGAGAARITVHRGALERREWSDRVCFAGLGPGEVTIEGRKLVGISQRRTRTAARFQMAVLHHWRAEEIVELLSRPRPAVDDLSAVATSLGELGLDADELLEALLAELHRL